MNQRIFDLDDVHAISDAFTVTELRWVTLPDAWKKVIPHAEREIPLKDDDGWIAVQRRVWGSDFVDGKHVWPNGQVCYTRHVLSDILLDQERDWSVGLDELDRRYEAIVAERLAKPNTRRHLFSGLEVSWMKRTNTFEEVLDPLWLGIIELNRGGTSNWIKCEYGEGGASGAVEMEDWDNKSEVEVMAILGATGGGFDRYALNIMTRYLDALNDVALCSTADQAMAEQGDEQPVRRARARL
ncbi:hypothetical protein [Paraburkholderia sp. C35]|uniref:hypothetical protein n=1 Tax=Paraburkholderia sp. C35 TaxID=2126993 RepID=UPI000D69967D|nr:hypothetical protein [Paraburkholderia sp. C35]